MITLNECIIIHRDFTLFVDNKRRRTMSGWTNKVKWSSEQWKQYRRKKGIPPKSDMPTNIPAHITAAGRELCAMIMCPRLDWPDNLFEDIKADSAVQTFRPKVAAPNLCHYKDCMKLHNNCVSATKTVNGTHHVRWFCCGEHQRKWYAKGSQL
jgi:hypothetical protein